MKSTGQTVVEESKKSKSKQYEGLPSNYELMDKMGE